MEILAREVREGDVLVGEYGGMVTDEPILYSDVQDQSEMVALPMGRAIQHMPAGEYVQVKP